MDIDNQDEEKPFLPLARDALEHLERPQASSSWSKTRKAHYIISALNLLCLLLNVGALAYLLTWNSKCGGSTTPDTKVQDPYSPAHEIAEYEIRRLDFATTSSPFAGTPRKELDEAWSDLLRPSSVNVPAEEMKAMNKTSLAVDGTDGYVGYYEVFHQLHCLKRMYQMHYKEYYPDVMAANKLTQGHWDHCIEVLRQGLMCKPDLTVNTYRWDASGENGIKGFTGHERKCINWSSFKTWADSSALPASWQHMVVPQDQRGSVGP